MRPEERFVKIGKTGRLTIRGSAGNFDLYLDGKRVGRVWKKVVRYNLRRTIVTTEWVLSLTGLPTYYRKRRWECIEVAEDLLVHNPDTVYQVIDFS